jgi:hypothetical protein
VKLRIRGDSIRLRLKQSEVNRIAAGDSVVEETHFPDAVLRFSLKVSGNNDMSASLDGGSLEIRLPKSMAQNWAATDTVSLHAQQDLPNGGALSLLIEKDFTCLEPGGHRDSEDDQDTFAHPDAS